jgi:hypothetical protein
VRLAPLLIACLVATGCGGSGKSTYTAGDIKAAYYRAAQGDLKVENFWADQDFHSHSNYVPLDGLEVCPLSQRANAASQAANMIQPKAAQPVQQFVVGPKSPDDTRTPTVTQGAFVFGTSRIAGDGMDAATAAMAKCPATYEVRGGPPTILGTYGVSMRPVETSGWKGIAQQIAHTYPPAQDDVYYEDLTHVVVHRANVILYLDVSHDKIIGERADSATTADAVLETVLKRLG